MGTYVPEPELVVELHCTSGEAPPDMERVISPFCPSWQVVGVVVGVVAVRTVGQKLTNKVRLI
jgi:hypothetical protein